MSISRQELEIFHR